VTYTLFGVIYTVVTIPYAALSAVISNDYQERSGFTSVRMMFALAGGTIVSVGMLPLVDVFGGEAIGFQWTMIVFGVMATLLLWLTFRGTEEGAFQDVTTSKVSFRDSVRVVVANVPLWITIALFCLGMLAFTFRFSTAPFYLSTAWGAKILFRCTCWSRSP
jgi:GPH family glycoside/pentoside/hexuronide:cation symporter